MSELGSKRFGTEKIDPELEVLDCMDGFQLLPEKMKQVGCSYHRLHRLHTQQISGCHTSHAVLMLHTSCCVCTHPSGTANTRILLATLLRVLKCVLDSGILCSGTICFVQKHVLFLYKPVLSI